MARRYFYNYQTITRFSAAVGSHFFLLRCVPCVNRCQRLEASELFVHPTQGAISGQDAWGNGVQHGNCLEAHDHFVFVSSGEVTVEPYCVEATGAADVFRTPSKLAAATPEMLDAAAHIATQGALDTALAMAEMVNAAMNYTPGTTFMDTTAATAFAQRSGVCQDYAHVLIALCRARGIAARYVNGFIPGVGATHAWVEVLDKERWWGVDPTNNRKIDYGYVKLAHGRDAADCPVARGTFCGVATQQNEIRVIVEQI